MTVVRLAVLMLSLTLGDGVQAATNLQAVHRNGQTFLTWTQAGNPATSYRVYRAGVAIAGGTLASAELLGTAPFDSSANRRLNTITNPTGLGTTNQFRIDAAAAPLGLDQGLFVQTIVAAGASFYAVTEVTGGTEDTTLVAGQNTLAAAVAEAVGTPEPVWQRTYVSGGRTNDIYVHWAGRVGHAGYPAMASVASLPFNFALQRKGAVDPHPLVIRLHFKGGNFLSLPFGTPNQNEWILMLDDWLPNPQNQDSFWYGYHENFNPYGNGGVVPTTGTVPDYTVRRVRWTFDWALRQGVIDTNRVYMTGSSMGGIGSFFLSMLMPDRIAAIYTQVPKFDFAFNTDPNPNSQWNEGTGLRAEANRLWGTTTTNLPAADGLAIYDRLNAGKLAQVYENRSLPLMIAFNGRYDVVVGWAEKIPFYAAMQTHRHGGWFFFDTRTHGGVAGFTPEWTPQEGINPVNEFDGIGFLNLFRLDQSYPAFSHGSADNVAGNGLSANGDPVGSINGHLIWDRSTIVDTPFLWETTIRTQNLTMQPSSGGPVTVNAPASATVDITPRRLQQFAVAPGQAFAYQNLDAGSQVVQSGMVVADALGLITVPAFQVGAGGNRLVLAPAWNAFANGFE